MRPILVGLLASVVAMSGAWAGSVGGKYEGKTPSGKLYVTVKKLPGEQYKADLETYGRGNGPCVGQMGVSGVVRGKVLETAPPAPGEAEFCPVKITFNGRSARVAETGDRCDARGMMCSFNGTVRKVK